MKVKKRITHQAAKIDNHGRVSALCFEKPRAIPQTSRYVIAPENADAVNCPKCLKLLPEFNKNRV